ncbi:MAG TPA: flavocytochrome c [Syntrophales bacterium]|nr:flavocytochrome c [Syntrophales bacterium]
MKRHKRKEGKRDDLNGMETTFPSMSVSRRSVLKGAIGLGVLASAGGLAMNLTVPGSAEAAVRVLPKKWDEEVDVVIVGSGFAGLAAAAEAASVGSKVVILEKMPTYGGNSIINGGVINAWDDRNHLRKKLNLGDDSWQLFKNDTLKGGDFYNYPELVEVMVKDSPNAVDWLLDDGVKFRNTLPRMGGHSAYRSYMAVEGVGRGFTEPMKKVAEQKGAKLRLGTQVSWIWRKDADSPVLGVEVTKDKKKRNIKIKKALVLASGGFSRDVKMRMTFNPSLVPEYNCTNQPGATGEVIRYAQAIGAETIQMAFIQLYPCAEPETGMLDTPAVYPYTGTGYGLIYVNKAGKRFISELERRDVVSMAQIKSGSKPSYSILSEEVFKKLVVPQAELEKGIAKGRILKADTVIELAGKLGIPADSLQETINRHNKFIADGKDLDFNKPITKNMVPLVNGPFYAIAQWPSIHHCMGGLRINASTQVIDIWGNPIPRLYAAGEVCGGVQGSNRLGGNATTDCVVFGRIAGTNAGKEKA